MASLVNDYCLSSMSAALVMWPTVMQNVPDAICFSIGCCQF